MLMKKLGAFLLDLLEVIVFAIAIFLFVYLLILQPHKIKGESMMPNFEHGQYLLTDKVTYRFREPERGDIVVFEAPQENGDEYIKRIIATPGETITIEGGKVFINEKILTESYIPNETETNPGVFLQEGKEVKIPVDNYIVLGDNRPNSSDSRTWGFVTKDKITGRGWFMYWPISKLGTIEKVKYSI